MNIKDLKTHTHVHKQRAVPHIDEHKRIEYNISNNIDDALSYNKLHQKNLLKFLKDTDLFNKI